ncbi:MAG: hypothetical protein LIP01_04230 [Tannerellaceae bacterium]|nr:hypothetical protein [Tannerellaceae bacterium]
MKNIFLYLSILFTFVCLSCQEEEERIPQTSVNSFSLHYTIPTLGAATRSEIVSQEGEDQVNTFYDLFFENTTGGTGQCLTAIDLMGGRQNPLSTSGVLTVDYAASDELSATETYKVLLCANMEAYNTAIQNLSGLEDFCRNRTEKEVAALLQVQIQEDTEMSITNLPMSASVVKEGGKSQVSVDLVRAVSRFDVTNRASGYELVGASLWNVYTSTNLWDTGEMDFSGNRTERYYGIDATAGQIIGGLYGLENRVENPAQNDGQTTALIIEMKNQETGESEFFRANIHPVNKSQQLKRNNIYQTAITQVLGKGFPTEREAYESKDALLITDINGWMADPGNNVVFDDNNILAVPTSVITLPIMGDTRTYNIFTDGEGTLTMTTEEIPSDVKVKLEGNKLQIEAPAASAEWGGILTFAIGNLTTSIQIQQAEHIYNYLTLNFDVEELPLFDYAAGSVSPEIEVMSTGAWVAEIFGGDCFSFSSSPSRVDKINGEANTGFNIYTMEANMSKANRYCFVQVSLVDAPEINRVLVLEQEKYEEYIRFVKIDNKKLSAQAHIYIQG